MRVKKAPGPDHITVPMLKNSCHKIICQLYYFFKYAFTSSYFPSPCKEAKVIPILKPGKFSTDPSSFRPITLLPIVGKIFERVILFNIENYIEKKNIWINQQFGFRANHSTIHQVARITQHITHSFNVRRDTVMILLDLSKAFDTVWHKALLFKLSRMGIPYTTLRLLKSYLEERTCYVLFNSHKSIIYNTSTGGPPS
ncbi:hypothetical protein KPH14_012613 [Odynerus spinipes]|uniref:Reverse transcriptase domain-containing protein n=1 Tax=Odynerus spinipes TaxID=1348599 RepID=A0AAD9VKZ8_9HYME|nr:hypothetical protein KPH14_012613 [Odynerus spinipes]